MSAPPRLIAITPVGLCAEELAAWLPGLAPWVDAVHLRWPHLSPRENFERAVRLAAVDPRPALLINDRFDLALAAGLEGVHLRDDGIAPSDLPASARPRWVGVSRHDLAGVRRSGGADYLCVSPVRRTPSKPGATPLGEEGLRTLCRAATVPVLALGGITLADLPGVLKAGAHGVAVLRGILGARDPLEAARAYRQALKESLRNMA